MAKFILSVLAKAKVRKTGTMYTTERIIATTAEVYGEVIRDTEQFDVYTRHEEFYEYDVREATPLAIDEFYWIDTQGVRYDNTNFEILELLEILEDDIKAIEY